MVAVLLWGVQAVREGQCTRENTLGGNREVEVVWNLGCENFLKLFRRDRFGASWRLGLMEK
jgi:hypothetical protein